MQVNIQRHYVLPYKQEWWEQVKGDLVGIANCKLTAKELRKKLQYFCMISSFHTYPPDLDSLFAVPEARLIKLFSEISAYVLKCEREAPVIPLFRQKQNLTHSFQKAHIVMMLCHMALMLTPSQELQRYDSKKNFPRQFNFSWIFSFDSEKLKPILNYLEKMLTGAEQQLDKGMLTIVRSYQPPLKLEDVLASSNELVPVRAHLGRTSIEQFSQCVKIDFANKFIGGGSLDHGNVQEEIMFLCHPELFVSMVICERMLDNEALAFKGFRKYYSIKGYGESLAYDSEETSITYAQDSDGSCLDYIVAIDALKKPDPQFSAPIMLRELNKANIGFRVFPNVSSIATGNWGCGVFGGDCQLKFILQWLAASLAKKQLQYCAYESHSLEQLPQIINLLQPLKVSELMKRLLGFEGQMKQGRRSVFSYLAKQLEEGHV